MAETSGQKNARMLRLSIRAILDELDGWIGEQSRKRKAKMMLEQIGSAGLLASDEQKLQASIPPEETSDKQNCIICNGKGHITADCKEVLKFKNVTKNDYIEDNPSHIVHWGLLHRLYNETSILYRLHYKEYWEKLDETTPKPYGVNYYEIAVAGAVEAFKSTTFTTNQIRRQETECKVIISQWYSRAFGRKYDTFCNIVANVLDEEGRCQFERIVDTCKDTKKETTATAE